MIERDWRLVILAFGYFSVGFAIGLPRAQRWLSKTLSRHPEFLAHARPAEYYGSPEFQRWLRGAAIFCFFCGVLTLVLILL